jgi:hypothetical protein
LPDSKYLRWQTPRLRAVTVQQYCELCRCQLMAKALLDPEQSIEKILAPSIGWPKSN